ncbi:lactate 2-monooxygenase [Verticillium dahliae VdLs.17]|uniref:Lactate 2-monooxygenase n=1 Tax=Verticillium dahliae (strain VdLs.17 / ATCC MYA-4575 / FGSC 10137) TaxID=498257 RepID=G2XHN9_VERDV|nr:lactate 2-monooxygenase [Verticillium dahliae VdLs.17]EGY19333.1 lactate 2-monooxygenase [Verticillium dahliae VdLs.17]KAH6704461.1 lactate 2-monooxygenase [Verticillium dahliae]
MARIMTVVEVHIAILKNGQTCHVFCHATGCHAVERSPSSIRIRDLGNPLRTAGSTPRPTPRRPSRRAPGLPSALPTTSSSRIEDVASAHDAGRPAACTARAGDVRIPAVPRFFQFYTPHDDELTVSLLRCAHESGSTTSMQRTDTWQLGWRHVDVATSNRDLNRGSGADLGLSDPFFPSGTAAPGPGTRPLERVKRGARSAAAWSFLIKGIQRVDNAERAADLGFDGVVRGGLVVTFDSGVRGAADIVKAPALGANLFADLDILTNVAGINRVEDITKDLIKSLPPSYALLNKKAMLPVEASMCAMGYVLYLVFPVPRTV